MPQDNGILTSWDKSADVPNGLVHTGGGDRTQDNMGGGGTLRNAQPGKSLQKKMSQMGGREVLLCPNWLDFGWDIIGHFTVEFWPHAGFLVANRNFGAKGTRSKGNS